MQWNETRVSKCPLKSAAQIWGDWDILWEHLQSSLDFPNMGFVYFIARKDNELAVVNYIWDQALRETEDIFTFVSLEDLIAWLIKSGPRELGSAISRRMLETMSCKEATP